VSGFNEQEKPSLTAITHSLPENSKWQLDFCRSPCMSELTTIRRKERTFTLLTSLLSLKDQKFCFISKEYQCFIQPATPC